MMKSFCLSRRTVLRGLGATIALPYLEIMGGKTAAAAAKRKDPPRLGCFYIPGAVQKHTWFPQDTGFNYTLAPSHKPLAHHRDNFTVISSLLHIQGQISGHVHPYNWLTGHNINLNPGSITNTVSIDQVAAAHIGPTYVPSLVLSWHDGVGTSTLSRNALGVDIPATANYRSVFEKLFPPADSEHVKAAKARIELDKSVLDTAMEQVHDFRRNLGHTDQQRLDQYLDSVRDVEQRLTDRESILDRGRPKFDEKAVDLEPQGKNGFREHLELMTDLITLAFQTDMTRVVTQVLGGEGGPNYDEYKDWATKAGAPLRGAHDVHHKGQTGADTPEGKVLAYRDEMLCAVFARLMDKLQAIQASDGTLLDHTILLFGGSQIHSHVGTSFPMILAGGKKLGFKHGQHLKFKGNSKPASDLYLTMLQQLGCPVTSFKESAGPISELLA